MNKKTKNSFALSLAFATLLTTVVWKSAASASTILGGDDRYGTALKIVQKGWTTSDNVIIARGDDLADALVAAPLAYAKDKAPILLTNSKNLSPGVLKELIRLDVKNVYIIGGTGAISTDVQNELKDYNVKRISGKNRVETSYEIAIEAFDTIPSEVVIANGLAYADALSISSIAAVNKMPILLVLGNKLSPKVATYTSGKTIYAVGGPGVLSNDVVADATRLAGNNRYETNAEILDFFTQDYSKVYIAKGTNKNLVDALAGSALAALGNNPIVLVDGKSTLTPNLTNVMKDKL
ncbi:cell wall-binding repeat-containing protein, partial [Clostridium sp.]|uniref:cell wall-binding repeat-containing protein n=1 Tax=Clostridium sp. TaxID=1506 RepID=UPI003F4C3771